MKEWVCSISSRTFPHHPHPLRHSGFHNGTEITTLSQASGQCKLFSITIQVLTMFQRWQDFDLTASTCWYSALVSLIISAMLNNASKYLVRKAPCIFVRPSVQSCISWRYRHYRLNLKLSQTLESSIFWAPIGLICHDEWLVISCSHTTPEKSANLLLLCYARVRGFKHTPKCNCLPLTRRPLQPVVDEDLMMRLGYNVCYVTWAEIWDDGDLMIKFTLSRNIP